MLDSKTKERIKLEAAFKSDDGMAHWSPMKAYIAGAEAEAIRAQGLAKALKGMVDYWKWSIGDPNFKEYKAAVEVLTKYNNPVNK